MNLSKKASSLAGFLFTAFFAVPFSSSIARADITYVIDTTITSANPTGNPLQSNTVDGSITTDGTIGPLVSGTIKSWDLNLIDGLNSANDYELTTANSSLVENTGNALSATATGLSFDFSGTGEFLIQADTPGPFSGYRYFCFSTGVFACLAGETISPAYITVDGVVATGAEEPVGQQPLNQTPEPSSVVLLATVMVAAAYTVRKRISRSLPMSNRSGVRL